MLTRRLAPVLLGLVSLAAPAPAGTIAFQLQLSGDHNYPSVKLTNSSSSLRITRFDMTIGDLAYNFDSANQEYYSAGITFTRRMPDADGSGGIRFDRDRYTYTGFGPAKYFKFRTDLDPDSSDATVDYRHILFDLGGSSSSDNSLITVTFSDGSSLSGRLPDFALNSTDTYTFSRSKTLTLGPLAAAPEPGGLTLICSAALALLGYRAMTTLSRKIPG